MFRIFPVKEFAERKQLLLAQSDIHRQTLLVQLDTAQMALAQVRKRFTLLGASSVALSVGASIAGILFARKQSAAPVGGGIISKVFSAFSLVNQVKGLFNRFKQSSGEGVGIHPE